MKTLDMGFCMSKEEAAARERSRKIDQALRNQSLGSQYDVKLLLLGTGDSGKSTILKQLRIAYDHDFTLEERMSFREVVQYNTVEAMAAILKAMGPLKISLGKMSLKNSVHRFLEFESEKTIEENFPEMAEIIKELWRDNGVRECFRRSAEYQLLDSAEYFLNDIERISMKNYCPSQQDILRVRVRTVGVIETTFVYKNITFRVYDVGGQRSIRRKWIHLFEHVTSVIFVVAISEYDLTLEEDGETNRMRESMKLFDSIANNKFFESTSIILFLNKVDIFKIKIQTAAITICFPDYTGNNSLADATNFIRLKFEQLDHRRQKREMYTHITCATDTENMQFVFAAVTESIIRSNLMDYGIV